MQTRDWWSLGATLVAVVAIVGGTAALFLNAPRAADGLEGKVWVVDQLTIGGASQTPIPGTTLTATFKDGVVSGVAGCNDYFGGYEVDDDAVDITEIGSTRAFCGEPEGPMDQEIIFLGLLQTADRFERDGDGLTLRAGDRPLIMFGVHQ